MFTFIIFLLVLSLVVLVHEFGHFFVARLSGMKVFEFGWGFPPRAIGFYRDPLTKKIVWVWKSRANDLAETVGGVPREQQFPATLYSINWLPLGGFVKIKGENGDTEDEDSFSAKKFGPKLATLLAGVVMNFILAAILLGVGFMIGLPTDLSNLGDERAIIVKSAEVMIQHVEKDSPAAIAGLKTGDVIRTVNGTAVQNTSVLINLFRESEKKVLNLEIKRDELIFNQAVTPVYIEKDGVPRLGVGLADAGVIRFPWYLAFYKGFVAAGMGFLNVFVAFYILVRELILGNGLAFGVSGPVGIAVAVGESARLGFSYLLNVTAMISLSLAALNVLPIPALDGGRALFVIIEKLFRRKIPIKVEQITHTVGFVALLFLIVVITWRDISALF
ncbi:MAG: RIP metalloprotease RseP [Candidatus Magasanikbacteria bacterium RIFCSPHIGHO2_01_FULL_41_23]|uniref:Zinc metalloprotease n=1 Tax=Candidatus Magasanikbacteria bacterium RIFCSPLOWO2_01_FULL_40_15 TaxID=1798686 RepID=A0A1F6N2I2_9BACT|nr:MAG: RIP metalloprotease RseP [Candidatus Magasanikbacteria bacterium RIFCSPHIGHO2_01_FULL_41_23]OGH66881.1 MAG: RIP metalloprotease RseP [Candidatus Magasanikbacteria bacterium RIFCSPHIGHO2_02_FULL_41_35]OGH74865.1 MAG: RIP metalloprotease RseP [Candidatus Magasanikbacteria bacterium RIFCSPHIGHO2_12_FULL_41_16]OGH78139.1 MAG: RIP metalloprotease RseP [Candidatus Magasanikbacteria bacterium RIFCSPLOWO2_01_FULL_40_15]